MVDDIAQYQALEQEKKRIEERLKGLEQKESFQQDLQCKKDLVDMLRGYDREPRDLPRLFPELFSDGTNAKSKSLGYKPKKRRQLIRYRNPNTGDTVESRGLNHKTLRAWIEEHGKEAVKGWGTPIDESDA